MCEFGNSFLEFMEEMEEKAGIYVFYYKGGLKEEKKEKKGK